MAIVTKKTVEKFIRKWIELNTPLVEGERITLDEKCNEVQSLAEYLARKIRALRKRIRAQNVFYSEYVKIGKFPNDVAKMFSDIVSRGKIPKGWSFEIVPSRDKENSIIYFGKDRKKGKE